MSSTAPDDATLLRALRSSHYPGAADDSVYMVIAYCRAMNLDPMLKPVHIVPMPVKDPNGREVWRDVIMPGIGMYRIIAARSGAYVGKSSPEFGPMRTFKIVDEDVEAPEWCQITVRRLVSGQVCDFTVREYFIENYGTRKGGYINAMWRRRTMGQLAKCAESQALRAAFPDSIPAGPTAEERIIDHDLDLDHGSDAEAFSPPISGTIEHRIDTQAELIAAQLRARQREAVEQKPEPVETPPIAEPRRLPAGGPTIDEVRMMVDSIGSTDAATETLDIIRTLDVDQPIRSELIRSVNERVRVLKAPAK